MLGPANAPHLVLGMRSDSDGSERSSAFARATRRVKNSTDATFSIEDLTASLSKLEVATDHAHSWFALPCDPGAIRVALPKQVGSTLVQSYGDAVRLIDEEQSLDEPTAEVVLVAAMEAALAWDWSAGIELSRLVLKISRDEQLRDEALNISAACHCLLNESSKAVDALKHAVQGQWNLSLQTNLAIVATSNDPSLAAEQMRFLIEGAAAAGERLAAALRAIDLWRTAQEELTGSADADDHADLPDALVESIRQLMGASDLSEEDFFALGKFLVEIDGPALLSSNAFAASLHRKTASGELIAHRAEGFGEYLKNLVPLAIRHKSGSPWLDEELEQVVQSTLRLLSADDDSVGVGLGFMLLDQGLDCSTRARVLLHGLTTVAVASSLNEGEAPNESFIGWMLAARRALGQFDDEDREVLRDLVDRASWILAAQYHDQIAELIRNMAPAVGRVKHQMGGPLRRMSADKVVVGEVSRAVVTATRTAGPQISALLEVTVDDELRGSLRQLSRVLDEFHDIVNRYV